MISAHLCRIFVKRKDMIVEIFNPSCMMCGFLNQLPIFYDDLNHLSFFIKSEVIILITYFQNLKTLHASYSYVVDQFLYKHSKYIIIEPFIIISYTYAGIHHLCNIHRAQTKHVVSITCWSFTHQTLINS
jgi:hypothetical protein